MVLAHSKASTLSVGLSLVLVMLLAVHIMIHTDKAGHALLSDGSLWRQPPAVAQDFPHAISPREWKVDFQTIEHRFPSIKVSQSGELILGPNTVRQLEVLLASLPKKLSEPELMRVAFLVETAFLHDAGNVKSKLLTHFYRYQQALLLAETQSSSASELDKDWLHDYKLQQQQRYFGPEVAEQLFGQQNAVNQYLLTRRRIHQDSSLNVLEKQAELKQLQQAFKADEP